MGDKLGIYIHIPFCRSKCDYCDFYSLSGREGRMDHYQKALLAHLRETAPLTQGIPVDSVYFGGGTPSFYGAKRLKELLATLHKLFQIEKDAEITVECNPDSVDLRALCTLRKAGVNRLSLGMQSAQAEELAAIHRIHTPQQTDQAAGLARKAKFNNLSLDLIYGLPGQTMDSWKATVEHALSLIPQHLSCYGLKVEEGTPLARRVAEGEVLPDDDQQADLYLWMVGRLARAGYPSMRSPTSPSPASSPGTISATGSPGPISASAPGPTPISAAGATPSSGIWTPTSTESFTGAMSSTALSLSPSGSGAASTSCSACAPPRASTAWSTAGTISWTSPRWRPVWSSSPPRDGWSAARRAAGTSLPRASWCPTS